MKVLVFDIDGTICDDSSNIDYSVRLPHLPMVEKIRYYKKNGFKIVFNTARNMQTYEGAIGKINANTLPILITWLKKYDVPYDEIYIGKPWCGTCGYYIDDKSIRPVEFLSLSHEQIIDLLNKDAKALRDKIS